MKGGERWGEMVPVEEGEGKEMPGFNPKLCRQDSILCILSASIKTNGDQSVLSF